jgi:hypothetical protein
MIAAARPMRNPPPLRTLLLAAILLAAGPAFADETAYLLYLKGTEGKTTPFRVLWNEIDDANARITIDVGTGYEPWLKKLGLTRVLAYDAKLQRREFVVRDPALTRFVNVVSNDLVRGVQQANLLPGVAPITSGAQVEGAVLFITPSKEPAQLEVTARLHVTYPVPQKGGPPVVKDLINGDLIFVGAPEPKGAGQKAK